MNLLIFEIFCKNYKDLSREKAMNNPYSFHNLDFSYFLRIDYKLMYF